MTAPSKISSRRMVNRLPPWFKQEIPDEITQARLQQLRVAKVNTVCQAAHCPNLSDCFKYSGITFIILGKVCTRSCRFCAVDQAKKPSLPLDAEEPLRISRLAETLGLRYTVITSVTRDDLSDGGAGHFARTVELVKDTKSRPKVELLIPDFNADTPSLKKVIAAGPDLIGHNLETVRRLYRQLKPDSDYQISLLVLEKIKDLAPGLLTKSSLLLGLGETEKEVLRAMQDLRALDCDILTLGQYLAPSARHYPVKEFLTQEEFARYRQAGISLGFKAVLSGPLVRSSYRAQELYKEVSHV